MVRRNKKQKFVYLISNAPGDVFSGRQCFSPNFACMAGGASGKSMAVEIALTPNAKR